MDLELVWMCFIAFAAVFVLLTVLSVLMAALTTLFPGKVARTAVPSSRAGTDAAVLATITATMNELYPGASVSRIEEAE